MGKLVIDGKTYTADLEGRNLLEVCLSLGMDLPYFCWHPAMHSVGACRQCAVKLFKDEHDEKGRIVMSCMTAAADGMRLSIKDPEAAGFRSQIIDWLMVNHPHDCPVCDEGGECHLQDMTVMSGHVYRSYRFTKRTHTNQDLGPRVTHEMNRCIQCYRCVRFYRDYAGGRDLDVLGCHDNVYFGRITDGTLESPFSGNLAEVCPTGVFTDKSLKAHYSRKWDLRTAPSICVHCGVGCNTAPGERYGLLRRIKPRYNGEVNGSFLCDRGRYGYTFVNAETRIRAPLQRTGSGLSTVPADAAVKTAAEMMGSRAVIGIVSARASLETMYALGKLVGAENLFLDEPDAAHQALRLMADILRKGTVPSASVREAREADAGIILGEDVWNTAPILALNLRQAALNAPRQEAMRSKKIPPWDDAALREAVQDAKGPFFIATPQLTGLDASLARALRAPAADIAALGSAIAREVRSPSGSAANPREDPAALIAAALKAAERPLVVAGGSLGTAVILAAAEIAEALAAAGKSVRFSFVFPECNSLGAALMTRGGLESAARRAEAVRAGSILIAESGLPGKSPAAQMDAFPGASRALICLEHTRAQISERADVFLPAATFAESSGTFVSSEGRTQRFFAVLAPASPVAESWRWIGMMARAAGRKDMAWNALDDVLADMAAELPLLARARDAAPLSGFRSLGMRIPRDSHRVSGRTSNTANLDVHEPTPPEDPDSPLSYSMEGAAVQPPSPLIPRFWSPGWNSDQSVNKFQDKTGGALRGGDPGVRLFEVSDHGPSERESPERAGGSP